MQLSKLFVVLLFASSAFAAVKVLHDFNFVSETKTGVTIVEFYAPWCGHCKKLAPVWAELGEQAEGYKVANIDADSNRQIGERFGIKGFPTIKLIVDGKSVYDYEGPRTLTNFAEFAEGGYLRTEAKPFPLAKGAIDPASIDESDVVILTSENFDQTNEGDWLVEFYAPWCGHCKKLVPVYAETATALKGKTSLGKLDATQHGKTAKQFGVRGYPTIKFFTGGRAYDYTGDRSQESFETFVSGGYLEAASAPLPGPPTLFDEFEDVMENLEVYLRAHLIESVLGLVFGSMLLGFLLGRLTAGGAAPPAPKKSKKD